MFFSCLGSAYGTARASVGISKLVILAPHKILQSLVPVIMAGILSIYGMIICIINYTKIKDVTQCGSPAFGYKLFGAGFVVGLSALASGLAIGYSGDYLVRAYAKTDAVFVVLVLVMIFAECIALYGFIVAILMTSGS